MTVPFPSPLALVQNFVALGGDRRALDALVLPSLAQRAARNERLALVIGDNHFDAYRLARLARAYGYAPAALMARVHLSRPFTCYQLCARIASLAAQREPLWHALYVVGLLEMFYDEDVRMADAARLAQKTVTHLKQIAARGCPVLVTLAPPKQNARAAFVEIVQRAADAYWQPAPRVVEQFRAQQLPLTL